MTPVIVLVGLPAAGKTSAGRKLARQLRVPFADSDHLIEAATGRTVTEIFAADGEEAFRELEAATIAQSLTGFDGVLALGGGAVLRPETRSRLRSSGVLVVHLVTTAAAALPLVRGGKGRPLLEGDPAGRLALLEAERAPLYDEVATASVRSANRPMAHVIADLHSLVRPAEVESR
jgi:shikimate kinase